MRITKIISSLLITILAPLYSSVELYGQISQDGDSFILKRITDADINNGGADWTWDFSHASQMDEEIPVIYKNICDSMTRMEISPTFHVKARTRRER